MRHRSTVFIVIAMFGCTLLPALSHAQTPRQCKRHVEALLDSIDRAACAYRNSDDEDSAFSRLQDANTALYDYLSSVLPKMPLTMKFHDDRLWIATSADKNIRTWAWNTYEGGSEPQIYQLVEFQSASGIQVVNPYQDQDGGNDSWITEIKMVHTGSGHTYYLAIADWVGDGMHVGEQVDAYEISGTNLNTQVPLFQTAQGTLSEILYRAEPRSTLRVGNHFKLSPDGRTFFVPLTLFKNEQDKADDRVTMTRRSLKYEFDGEHFVYRGVTSR